MALIRYSIANLAGYARSSDRKGRIQFGILNPDKLLAGKRQYMALGGGAMLKEAGKKMLEKEFQAFGFEPEGRPGIWDARFKAEESHFENIFTRLAEYQTEFELSPALDILEELFGKEFSGFEGGIVSSKDLSQLAVRPIFTTRQAVAEAGTDTSGKAIADMPTRRLFRIYELVFNPAAYKRFAASPLVRILMPQELETTHGGATAGQTSDGMLIQNNLFVY
ncbi:MAG TPA: hypothetical protein VN701_01665 [Candidatus Paceibacterota bacterium]|nr:hypothetical protein [Candidatus Paceibacterota bacterium]